MRKIPNTLQEVNEDIRWHLRQGTVIPKYIIELRKHFIAKINLIKEKLS